MDVAEIEKRTGRSGAQLRLCVPPDPRLGVYVRREVLAFAEDAGIVDGDVDDFVAAIGEALANAIEHSQTREPIEVDVWLLGDDRLFASVRDRGVGFPAAERALEESLPDCFAERGRGLPIMRRCTDVLTVSSAPGHGTSVTLGRYVRRASRPLAG